MPGNTSTQYKDLLLTEPCACKLVIIGGLADIGSASSIRLTAVTAKTIKIPN